MIERKEIERLAELVRISISPEEAESLRKEIDSILEYVGQIQEVAAATGFGVMPEAGLVRNQFREDNNSREPGTCSEELLSMAPQREENYFKVKKILGGDDND
jgi:aspartyl-tRNA(Asn)/glutamyl-tRNA(Gln) amidotransferase subunit C